ncbi:YdcF family protein [Paenibacillus beijingensis]|uniref:DUF218 domain-containing protein n=1 Tax=Paenibacillus beijingensis TaxID=1126833 RepID=A0A0D5NGF0_9BACL|nr:YdcF family protein [Paenibacillus beijingensis]AJY73993.1 hypothetical protein VN24_04425 [Paenibacillus beijingensis]
MPYIIRIIYSFLLPPGIIIVLLFASSIFLFMKNYRKSSYALLICTILFYLSCLTYVGSIIHKQNQSQYPFPSEISGDSILVLGEGANANVMTVDGKGSLSGQTALNVIEVVKLYNKLHVPIILSGGNGLGNANAGNEARLSKRELLAMQVPEDQIIVEDRSRTTQENARYAAQILKQKNLAHPILVTSASHMARSVELFKKEGIEVTPLPVQAIQVEKRKYNLFDFLPSVNGLLQVNGTLREYLGKLQ